MGARWAAVAFGLGTPARVAPVARGFMGRVWRIDVDAPAPASYAVKELFWGDPDERAAEAEVAFATACRDAGVRGQVAVRSPAGRIVERAPDGVAWRAYEWVEGRVCDEAEVSSWLGRAAATIHAVGAGWAWHETGGDDWYERVDIDWAGLAGGAEAAGLACAGSLGALTGHLADLADTVNAVPPGERVVTHRDLMADNVLRAADGGLVLLDWDNTGPLAPWREAGLLVLLRRRDPRAAAQAQTATSPGAAATRWPSTAPPPWPRGSRCCSTPWLSRPRCSCRTRPPTGRDRPTSSMPRPTSRPSWRRSAPAVSSTTSSPRSGPSPRPDGSRVVFDPAGS